MRLQPTVPFLAILLQCVVALLWGEISLGDDIGYVEVTEQPLARNAQRLVDALDVLGAPLAEQERTALNEAISQEDSRRIQQILDDRVVASININPESRVRAIRGKLAAKIQQAGYVPLIVKVNNQAGITSALKVNSDQAGAVYGGMTELSMTRQAQLHFLENQNVLNSQGRFLQLDFHTQQPMTATLSGLEAEYVLMMVYASEAGKREATLEFSVGQGTQDLGFRAELPILFDIRPAISVNLSVKDFDGSPTLGSFVFLDNAGHVYPAQTKRLAPDLFFQRQIYRGDGETVLLSSGKFTVLASRGPEYRVTTQAVAIPEKGSANIAVQLQRWINPNDLGYFSGDHHIHAAGCAHYTCPSEGIAPADIFRQIKGEALNVGSVLTWGPGYSHQQQFFSPQSDKLSEPTTVMKYDVEVSGFGSQALGHVCLLNLREQHYPGSEKSIAKGWPTWTTPTMRWAKAQGAFTGYAHSASGLEIDSKAASKRLFTKLEADKDERLTQAEVELGLLPQDFVKVDADKDGFVTLVELELSHEHAADQLPNLAIPELSGVGAQEVFVTTALGVCDFISAMDTPRLAEWNCWYHLMNCGFPLKCAGETDFPCMSGARVGQGRTYVDLGVTETIDLQKWFTGLAEGRSYVSDGFAHAIDFRVDGRKSGDNLWLDNPSKVHVTARIAFAPEMPLGIAYGDGSVSRLVGDTVTFHGPKPHEDDRQTSRTKVIELIVNGRVAAKKEIPSDGQLHDVEFDIAIEQSSWVALRQFPQLHTNPVNVLIAGKPIRASRKSAQWCINCIEQLWAARSKNIAPAERADAEQAFSQAKEQFRTIVSESPEGS